MLEKMCFYSFQYVEEAWVIMLGYYGLLCVRVRCHYFVFYYKIIKKIYYNK